MCSILATRKGKMNKKHLLFLIAIFAILLPLSVKANPKSIETNSNGITVSVSDPNNVLPDNTTVTLKEGSLLQKTLTQNDAIKELNEIDKVTDGSFISERYDNASIKKKESYLYNVKITYEENGEVKEYTPVPNDGVSISFSVEGKDFSKENEELDIFSVTKNNASLINDSVENDGNVEVKATENGEYLILALDYIAKEGSADKQAAEEKSYEIMTYMDPEYHLQDELSSTYNDEQFNEMKAGAEEAISGLTSDYDKIEALTKLVANRTYYDFPYLDGEQLTALNPYDVWTKKITVCDGYSRLMKTLCVSVGIPCTRIYSDDHAYNACYDGTNKRWIVLDATWASGNKYTKEKELKEGSYRPSYFDMTSDFMAQISSHEIFSLSGILFDNAYYSNYPNYTAKSWYDMKWSTWADMTDWHFKVSGIKSGTILKATKSEIAGLPVTEVEEYALQNKGLTSVRLSDNIQEIEKYAFKDNYDLKSVFISGTKPIDIYDGAFQNDSSLTTFSLDERSIGVVGDYAFRDDSSLKTFGNDKVEMNEVGYAAFYKCNNLEDDIIVKSNFIDSFAFYNCKSIKYISCPSLTSISSRMCYGCSKLEEINVSTNNINEINPSAFYNCEKLVKPTDWSKASFDKLPDYAFFNNKSLPELKLPSGLTSIGYGSLYCCESIKEIDLSKTNLKTIGEMSFSGMNSLDVIRFPATLESVGSAAFQNTSGSKLQTYILGVTDKSILNYPSAWYKREAHFGQAVYTVKFVDNDNVIKEIRAIDSDQITVPAIAEGKDYYELKGWKSASSTKVYNPGEKTSFDVDDGSIVELSAIWKPIDYSISYNLNGGVNTNNPETYNIESSEISLNSPNKEHFKFTGWYSEETLENKVNSIPSGSHGNITLFAAWECLHDQTSLQNKKNATCSENGYSGDLVCEICKETINKGSVTDKASHTPGDPKKENIKGNPCIEETSYDLVTRCQSCNEIISTENKTEAKVGHIWDSGKITLEPTCTKEGVKTYTCDVCKETKNEPVSIDPSAHSKNTETKNAKEATCKEKGYTGDVYCKDCSKLITQGKEIPVDPDAHGNFEIIDSKEPTCTETGYLEKICDTCGIKKNETLKAKGHEWNSSYTTDKAATCTNEGSESIHCKTCDSIKPNSSRTIKTLNHNYGEWKTVKAATCTEKGTKERYCRSCGAKDSASIEAKGHSWRLTDTVSPTTEYPGSRVYTCNNCYTTRKETIPKLVNTTINVSSVKIVSDSNKIAAGRKTKLSVLLQPDNASDKRVKWVSSNTKIATVDQSGVVNLKKKTGGKKVTITAVSLSNGNVKTSLKLQSMKGEVKSIKLKAPKVIKAGKQYKINSTVKATKGANKKLKWISSNTKYVTVKNGKIKVLKAAKGKKVVITAVSTDGTNKKAKVNIKIK